MKRIARKTAIKVIYWNVVAAVLVWCIMYAAYHRRYHQYDELIFSISKEYQLSPRLVAAVVWKESRFDASSTGKAGEVGLMQVREMVGLDWAATRNLDHFSKHDLYKPETNIRAGCWYLRQALDAWNHMAQPEAFALAEYNAGRSNVRRWVGDADAMSEDTFIERITYPTTKAYVQDILSRYRG